MPAPRAFWLAIAVATLAIGGCGSSPPDRKHQPRGGLTELARLGVVGFLAGNVPPGVAMY